MSKEITETYEYPDQKIVEIGMEKEVKSSFIQYAMSVIMSRALPDVRDGLKPVHRRILYAMYEDKLTNDRPFRKSATTVGNVLGRYHPHGDAAVYDTMVRMAQTFSLRYPLVDGHGNFGNIDGDEAAAYRYTEARMSKIADYMLLDIEKNVVDFNPNFDNKLKEPVVLPSRFPNLLVNGSVGIAVGMATNMPPHNLCEIIDGAVALMDDPEIDIKGLMEYIKGPDFPTGATIYGTTGMYSAYTTGRGKILVRGKAAIEEEKHRIVITEIPYQVNKSTLVISMADCAKNKRIEGISDIRDESGHDGMRIVIDLKRDANAQVVLNQLYKYTQLQDTCAVNMLALVNSEPKTLNLKQLLEYYVKHQEEIVVRKTKFELDKALHDAHLNEGYKIAIDNIDEVIRIIRASANVAEAKKNLMDRFCADDVGNLIGESGDLGLSEEQAQAIVEMPLGRLSGLEKQKIEDRLDSLGKQIHSLREILADEDKIKQIIKDDLQEIKRRFGDARKTALEPMEEEIILEDLIERHTCVITLTKDGYIKRLPSDVYAAQRRGGKGVIGMTTKEEDVVDQVVAVSSHSFLLMFTNKGKIHVKKAYFIPETGRTAKGSNAVNIIDLEAGEKITALISLEGFVPDEYLTMVTRNGIVKRTSVSAFEYQRKGGKRAITLDDGDELLYVMQTTPEDEIMIATRNGNAVRFPVSAVSPMGRNARGVIGIRPEKDDFVAGVSVVNEALQLITVTENGFGKRSLFSDFASHNRGGKGMRCHNITDKTGKLAGIAAVTETDDILLITNDGTIIRTRVSEIPVYSRSAGGVIVMRPTEGSYIVNFALVADEEAVDTSESDGFTETVETEIVESEDNI